MKDFAITRVVTKDIITDSFQGLRNFFGLRLRGYEQVVNKHTKELIEEMNIRYKNIQFWRLSVNPLVHGATIITVYGRGEEI